MSFVYEALRDKPVGLWMLDSASPFTDSSGYNRAASASGTVNQALALTSGALYSSVFNKDAVGSFTSPIFQQGKETKDFSLEAWVRPVQKTTGYSAQEYRENLVPNPSIEGNISDYIPSGVEPTQSNEWTFRGAFSLKLTPNNSTPDSFVGVVGGIGGIFLGMQPGNTYTASGWCYAPTEAIGNIHPNRFRKIVAFTKAPSTGSGYVETRSELTAVAGTSTRLSVTFDIPVDATEAFIRLYNGSDNAADFVYWDALLVEKTTTTKSFFDGSLPGYEWTSIENASASRTRKDVAAVNLIQNPNAYGNGAGGSVNGWSHSTNFAAGGVRHDPTSVNIPNEGLVANYNIPAVDVKSWNVMQIGIPNAHEMGLGDKITVIFRARSNLINGESEVLTVSLRSGDGRNLVAYYSPVTLTNNFVTYIFTVDAMDDALTSNEVYMTTSTTDDTDIDFSFFGVYRNYTDSYFDGDSVGATWSGSINNSESYLLISESDFQVLGNSNQYDGLVLDGTKVSFTTKFLTTGEARAEYDLQIPRAVHLVGVHTQNKNSLYVDGVLVSEADISDVQKTDKFIVTDGKLYSGQTMSSKNIMLNGVSIYSLALSPGSVARHFAVGRSVVGSTTPRAFGGTKITVSKNPADILFERHWQTAGDWKAAVLSGVSADNDKLVPQAVGTTSMPGYWTDSCDLYDGPNPNTINAVTVGWDGEGVTVSASIDGVTWETVERGQNLSCIPAGFDPSGKELYIRIMFPGGIVDDPSYIDNLTVTAFKTGTAAVEDERTVTYSQPAFVRDEYDTTILSDDWGVEINSGGKLTITASTDPSATGPQTIEVWAKQLPGTQMTRNFSASSSKKNGLSFTSMPTGEWAVYSYILSAPLTTDIVFGGDVQIGRVVLYDAVLSNVDLANIVDSYTNRPSTLVHDTSAVAVAESSSAANIYAHDWAIESSG